METNSACPSYLVPDVLQEGLFVVLVGTAPSKISAAQRAYYANPNNKFWRVLFQVGLTSIQLKPIEYGQLLRYGLGLTDVIKAHCGVDADLPKAAWGHSQLRQKIVKYQPKIVAFTSKRGAAETLELPTRKLPYGLQSQSLEGSELWVLPSTSPLGHSHFRLEPWQDLAMRAKALRAVEFERP